MILSLQGCMAVGKTTAVNYLREHAPYIHISYEDNRHVMEEIRERGLVQSKFEDYIEIQRLWLRQEVVRYEKAKEFPCTLMDFGAEEIEFFTLNYPKSMGFDWEIESPLHAELEQVRGCLPDRILFLDASEEVLRRRKAGDTTRSRNSFDHHLKNLMPLKRAWFFGKENVDILNVDGLSPDEVGQKVKEWAESTANAKDV